MATILDHKLKRLELYKSVTIKEELSNDAEFIALINQYNNDDTLRDQANRLNNINTGYSTISNIKKYQKVLRRYVNKDYRRGIKKYFDRSNKKASQL